MRAAFLAVLLVLGGTSALAGQEGPSTGTPDSTGAAEPQAAEPDTASADSPSDAAAPAPAWPHRDADGFVTAIDLLTIGPGDHLWTSFGHTALNVMRFNPETREVSSKIYNWGDADFGGWGFIWSFFRGDALFRLTELGTMEDVVNLYATQGRTMVQQRFALTGEQARKVAQRLEHHADPSRRDYVYHHMSATCGTKVRDFFDDEVVDGAIRAQLMNVPDPSTPRDYGRKYFAGFFFAEIFNDIFLGRLHDEAWTKHAAMTMPERLSDYMMEVQVPDPKGTGAMVGLVAARTPIVHDVAPPPYRGEGRSVVHLTYMMLFLVLAMGVYTLRRKQVVLEDAGFWLFLWALPAGLGSLSMVFGALVSSVAEGRVNELLLSYPPTDLALIPIAILWWRGKRVLPAWLKAYGWVRLGLVLLALLGHGAGILIQKPVVLIVLSLVCTSMFLVVLKRFPVSEKSHAEVINTGRGPTGASPANAA